MEKEKNLDGRSIFKINARDIAYVGLFTAIIAVCAWISIPFGEVPFTLQTMGVCMAAGFLGWKRGLASVLVYILLGMCGVPVFAGFTGGIAKLAMPTGGYIVGFIFTALIVGFASDYIKLKNKWAITGAMIGFMALGILICYAFGTGWFMILYNNSEKSMTLGAALMTCVVPYLLPDLIKIIFASFLVVRLKKYMKLKNSQN